MKRIAGREVIIEIGLVQKVYGALRLQGGPEARVSHQTLILEGGDRCWVIWTQKVKEYKEGHCRACRGWLV